MVFNIGRWMTLAMVTKYQPMIASALRQMNTRQWENCLHALDALTGIVEAETNRRVDSVASND